MMERDVLTDNKILINKILNKTFQYRPQSRRDAASFLRNFHLSVVDLVDNVVRRLAVDGASDGLGGAEDLLDGAFQLPCHGAFPHDAGDVDDLFEGNVAAVLDVLDLLAVAGRLLEGADEESRSAGNDAHRRLTILNGQLDGDAETFPVLRRFCDIITNFLGRQTERSNFRRERRRGTDLATDGAQADDLDFSGIELGRHLVGSKKFSNDSYEIFNQLGRCRMTVLSYRRPKSCTFEKRR